MKKKITKDSLDFIVEQFQKLADKLEDELDVEIRFNIEEIIRIKK